MPSPSTAPSPTRAPWVTIERLPMSTSSSMTTGRALGGSSTPPMPTPAREMDPLADLGARPDRGPGVDHRLGPHAGADVHIARHQHDATPEKGSPPGRGSGHGANPGGLEVLLQGQAVGVLEGPVLDGLEAGKGEQEQDGLSEPLVDDHLVGLRRSRRRGPRPGRAGRWPARQLRVLRRHRATDPCVLPQLRDGRAQLVHRAEAICSLSCRSSCAASLFATSSRRSSGCTRATRTWPVPAGP